MAIESSCMRVSLEAHERGLPEADASVIRRDRRVGPDADRLRFEQTLHFREQKIVLKYAAGEDDRVCGMSIAEQLDCIGQSLRDRLMKSSRDIGGIASAKAIRGNSGKEWTEIRGLAVDRKRVRGGKISSLRELLQPDRGLPLEADFAGKSDECCAAVKQPSH